MPNPRKSSERLGYPSDYKERDFSLAENAQWGGFINVRVDDDLKRSFEQWYEGYPNESAAILEELLASGIKATLAYDPENSTWICSFTGRLVLERADRYVTTTRAGSMPEVIALACWKHVYLVKGLYHPYSNSKKPLWG